MVMVSVAVKGPPSPVFPRSLVVISNCPFWALNPSVGVKVKPSRTRLSESITPVRVRVSVSLPLICTPSVLVPTVKMPLVATRLTSTGLLPASGSAILMELLFSSLNTKGVSPSVSCGSGTVFSGGLLMAVILMIELAGLLSSMPSLRMTVIRRSLVPGARDVLL